MKIIGAAEEFWRARVTRVDTTEGFDFEWHDDILYREPEVDPGTEVEVWHVEAMSLGADERLVRLRTFADRGDADDFVELVREDLRDMSKAQFEDAYLTPCDTGTS